MTKSLNDIQSMGEPMSIDKIQKVTKDENRRLVVRYVYRPFYYNRR